MAYNQSDENFAQSSGSNFANNNFLPEIYSKKVLNFLGKPLLSKQLQTQTTQVKSQDMEILLKLSKNQ